ncbi:hypothetical protein AB835_04100 [Candidatus Endobugula sertula]|uniref:Glycosyl transferase family 1 n=1 Tax=Candidatus Endobugula sertula TaxID=62101 RepID=A0A1D2QS38_9GAMM|nr:hypothetical protein AB835_04100 [Candidatus Endobugula sertula]
MNIALIRQEQTKGDGGAQAIIDIILQVLVKEDDINVSLLCRKWESAQTISNDSTQAASTKKVIINPGYQSRQAKQESFNQAVREYLQQHHFDLIQSHERLNGCHIFRAGDGVHKVWLQKKLSISNWLQRWWLLRSSYHKALIHEEKQMFENQSLKKVICNSHMTKQEITNHFSIDKEKVIVIYNGVDTQLYKPVNQDTKATLRQSLNIPGNALVFMFSGSGFERKNLSTTIKAFSQLSGNCYLIVVGRDKKLASYKRLAKRNHCHDRVIFLGAQERSNMPSIYQMADVLVLPTLYDPFPNAILEALSSGLPCITSTTCGAIDIIPKHHCGSIVAAKDEGALIKAMNRYQEKELLARESINATTTAQQFTKEIMQKKLLQLYSDVLGKNHA